MIVKTDYDSIDIRWSPPAQVKDNKDVSENVGYFIERKKHDSDHWIPCTYHPVDLITSSFNISGLISG